MNYFKLVSVLLLSATLLFGTTQDAAACSCMQPTVYNSYKNASDVVVSKVVYTALAGQHRWFVGRTIKTFKGCVTKGDWVLFKTSASSAACGAMLTVGQTYLLFGQKQTSTWGVPVLSISSCSYNRKVSYLKPSDRKWLMGRTVCCNNKCDCADGSVMVNCFANPCQVTSCPTGQCEANYCGGCKAEYYGTYGSPQCIPCKDNSDCAWNQMCLDEQCLSSCNDDSDCNDGFECIEDGKSKVCTKKASNDQCQNLAGVNFGACKKLLGWGMINGECNSIGGCSQGDYDLFKSKADCQLVCIDMPF
ncbi:MAG TPA: hypothetical protein EYN66_14340 [Myxococcales bacterium]|nr:hypothetical protein [Myxococcales bacterium]